MDLSNRLGYGAAFNSLTIKDGLLYKEAKNDYGIAKIQKEVGFYEFVRRSNLSLSFPINVEIKENSLVMPFYTSYVPFHRIFWKVSPEKQQEYLVRIRQELDKLHGACTSPVSRDALRLDLYEEGFAKVLKRYDEVSDLLKNYDIETVNGIKILSFESLLEYVHDKVIDAGKTLSTEYCLIHGDCQFSNLLYSEQEDKFLFVDPRGYFGKSDVFGLPQYDFAKLLFALTGYDIFDSLNIESLQIEKKNLVLPTLPICFDAIRPVTLDTILMVSIWLGNAHCFKDNPAKAALSHFYARFIGTLVYISDRL